jgi:23S rRNA (adenine2503-C2)-methyltransferase
MRPFCGILRDELESLAVGAGYPGSAATAALTKYYRNRLTSFRKMDSLPAGFSEFLSHRYDDRIPEPVEKVVSADGTVKYLFEQVHGKFFESVLITTPKRQSVCVSSQSGCRMGCPFCVTATVGYRGNLTAGEMVGQVMAADDSKAVTHVVFMGMGEPLDNADEVIKACKILTSPWGLSLGKRNVTVSTVGIIRGVRSFLEKSESNLTLSLFSPFPAERAKVVPAELSNPASRIIDIMKVHSADTRRRLGIAYVMIEGVNDTDRHLEELKRIFSGCSIHVNLIPYHSNSFSAYRASDTSRISHFRHSLMISGVTSSIRASRGTDIGAACGLLAAKAVNSRL